MEHRSIYVAGMSHRSPIPAAKLCGDHLYSSLITGADAATLALPDSLEEQTANMFAQMRRILEAVGAEPRHVAKLTIWLNDRQDRTVLTGPWEQMFPDPETRPARVTLNRDLGSGKLIEAEMIAVLPAR